MALVAWCCSHCLAVFVVVEFVNGVLFVATTKLRFNGQVLFCKRQFDVDLFKFTHVAFVGRVCPHCQRKWSSHNSPLASLFCQEHNQCGVSFRRCRLLQCHFALVVGSRGVCGLQLSPLLGASCSVAISTKFVTGVDIWQQMCYNLTKHIQRRNFHELVASILVGCAHRNSPCTLVTPYRTFSRSLKDDGEIEAFPVE